MMGSTPCSRRRRTCESGASRCARNGVGSQGRRRARVSVERREGETHGGRTLPRPAVGHDRVTEDRRGGRGELHAPAARGSLEDPAQGGGGVLGGERGAPGAPE